MQKRACVCVVFWVLCMGHYHRRKSAAFHSSFNGNNIINIIKLSCSFYLVRIVVRHLAENHIIINVIRHSRNLARYSESKLHSDKTQHVVKTINYTKFIVVLSFSNYVNTLVDRKTVLLITINNYNDHCVHHNNIINLQDVVIFYNGRVLLFMLLLINY